MRATTFGWAASAATLLLPLLPAQKSRPAIYDPAADAIASVDTAVAKAKRDNKRVLVMYGGNWCVWCHKLHGLFRKDATIRKLLRDEYELVLVDTKAKGYGDLTKRWKSSVSGYPFLVVVDGNGHCVQNQETASLEDGPKHSPDKVRKFLDKHRAPPKDARKVYADALATAAKSDRVVFVHIGAPWCGWCHHLEDWLSQPEVTEVLSKDVVAVKIDQDRMTHGVELAAKLRQGKQGGIPWSAMVAPNEGEIIVTSDAPEKGNVGYPLEDHEIAHFMKMLRTVQERMTDDELAVLEKSLREAARAFR